MKIKKPPRGEVRILRYQAESNRCTRFCRPLPSHSAMIPTFSTAKLLKFLIFPIVVDFDHLQVKPDNRDTGMFHIYSQSSQVLQLIMKLRNTSIWMKNCSKIPYRIAGKFCYRSLSFPFYLHLYNVMLTCFTLPPDERAGLSLDTVTFT